MLTPTDFIFNDLSDSEKPNFIECVNPPHDSNVWHDRGDKIPKSTIKYKKIIGSTVQAGEHDYSNYLNFLNSYISCQDVSSQEDIFFPAQLSFHSSINLALVLFLIGVERNFSRRNDW